MTTDCLQLESGRQLQKRRGRWMLLPGERSVGVEIDGAAVCVTDPETGQQLRDTIVDRGAGMAKRPAKAAAGATGKGDRWQTLNAFVDVIAPRLSLAERAVWLVLYRHARDGVTEATARGLATSAAINKMTVARALRTLESVGLVWPVWKSDRKGSPSKYAMHHRPGECLARVLARGAAK